MTFVGAGAKYDIQKLRGENGHKNLANITADWKKIADSLRSTVDFLERNGIISSNVLYSNNALIPIIYHAFQNGGVLDPKDDHDTFAWLCIALLNRDFSGQSDTVIDSCKTVIDSYHNYFPHAELDAAMPKSKKTGMPSTIADWAGGESLMLNLIYRHLGGVNFHPLMYQNSPELDHIFPKSELRKMSVDKS